MNYDEIKKKALKMTNPRELINFIEDYKLQNDKDVVQHFREIDDDPIEYGKYNRKESK